MSFVQAVDLWPEDLETVDLRTPVALLKEQAALLGPKTKNLVVGRVETGVVDAPSGNLPQLRHRLEVYAPALQYARTILVVRHPIDQMYPVALSSDYFEGSRSCQDEAELTAALREIFHLPEVTRLLHSMLAQST
jgi:hypothetical protein